MDELTFQQSLRQRPPADPHYRLRLSTAPGAVAAAATPTSTDFTETRPRLFALRLAMAGGIVALFGGLLLAGLLTQPSERVPAPASSPTATWTPPPELTMEEIAPGVTQATLAGDSSFEAADGPYDFTFDPHGGVWLLSPAGLQRVGDDTSYPSPGAVRTFSDLSPAPDGALWVLVDDTVASFRDGGWTEAPPFPGDTEDPPGALEVLPDGTVWARSTTTLARLDDDAWTAYPIADEEGPVPDAGLVFPWDLAWTPDGSLWVTTNGARKRNRGDLLRFDGEVFDPIGLPVQVEGWVGPLVSGHDGALWAYLDNPPTLARFDGTAWESWGRVPRIQRTGICVGRMAAAPDGRLWAIARRGDIPCAGDVLGAYDGATWTDALRSDALLREDAQLRVAPDGNLWVEPAHGLFIIATPEALATAGPAGQSAEEGESTERATPDLLPLPIHSFVVTDAAGAASE